MIFFGIAGELVILFSIIYLPPLQSAFGTAALGTHHWLLLVIFSPALLAIEEGRKVLFRTIKQLREQPPSKVIKVKEV
jgi:hypothetical protein